MEVNCGNGIITLRPGDDCEKRLMMNFFRDISPFAKLRHTSTGYYPVNRPTRFKTVTLTYGEKSIVLAGTTDLDAHDVNLIREACDRFCTGGTTFIHSDTSEGMVVTLFQVVKCRHCNNPITDPERGVWQVCHTCVGSCFHSWKTGLTRAHGVRIGSGKHCSVCGIRKTAVRRQAKSLSVTPSFIPA